MFLSVVLLATQIACLSFWWTIPFWSSSLPIMDMKCHIICILCSVFACWGLASYVNLCFHCRSPVHLHLHCLLLWLLVMLHFHVHEQLPRLYPVLRMKQLPTVGHTVWKNSMLRLFALLSGLHLHTCSWPLAATVCWHTEQWSLLPFVSWFWINVFLDVSLGCEVPVKCCYGRFIAIFCAVSGKVSKIAWVSIPAHCRSMALSLLYDALCCNIQLKVCLPFLPSGCLCELWYLSVRHLLPLL